MLWATDVGESSIPAPADPVPQIREIFGGEGSTRLVATVMPPDSERDFRARLTEDASDVVRPNTRDGDGWHTTESVDYLIVIRGEVVCELDIGEVTLKPGDVLVQNGTKHRWRNRTSEPALVYAVPVGVPFRA
jgi:mannose-6-phosphate isomerase-like protein (cupin superfamily)